MSAHNLPAELNKAQYEIVDPGTGAAIPVDRWNLHVPLTIAASAVETNTLAAPTRAGQKLSIMAVSVGSGGSRAITVASAYDQAGGTVLTFDAVDERVVLESYEVGVAGSPSFEWRVTNIEGATGPTVNIPTLKLNGSTFSSGSLATGAGAGVTDGTGTVYKNSIERSGGLFRTTIMIDLTGLASSTTDLDIIGVGASAAYIAKLTAAECGATILLVRMTCLEAPAGGVTDIDLYSATEGTGVFDAGIGTLAETAVITSGGAWSNGTTKGATTVPLSTEYLYLTGGAGGTAATYTAGKFLIEIFGYT